VIRLELLRLIVDNSQYFVGWVPELVMLFLLRDQRFVTKCDRRTERGGGSVLHGSRMSFIIHRVM